VPLNPVKNIVNGHQRHVSRFLQRVDPNLIAFLNHISGANVPRHNGCDASNGLV
jgi:hypothetical protein